MLDVRVFTFIESPISKIFLFECAKYWASEGFQVYYVANYEQQELPPRLQGIENVDLYAEFMQITFVTAPEPKILIDYLVSLPKSAHLPRVLIVEDVTNFVSADCDFSLLCSVLKHTAHLCSKTHNDTAYLIMSAKFEPERLNVINLILRPSKIWRTFQHENVDEEQKCDVYSLQSVSLNPIQSSSQVLEFSLLQNQNECFLRFNNISELFEESCNYNNKVM